MITIYCPICGNRPEKKNITHLHEHYWCIECDKCNAKTNIWVMTDKNNHIIADMIKGNSL